MELVSLHDIWESNMYMLHVFPAKDSYFNEYTQITKDIASRQEPRSSEPIRTQLRIYFQGFVLVMGERTCTFAIYP
jgi:hypothetical protein